MGLADIQAMKASKLAKQLSTDSIRGKNQKYYAKEGILFEGFQNVSDWSTTDTGAVLTADTVNYLNGNKSLKLTPSVGGVVAASKTTYSISEISSVNQDMAIDLYLYNDPSEYGNLWIYISSSNSFGKYMYYNNSIANLNLKKGWNRLPINNADWISTADAWTNKMVAVRVRFSASAGKQPSMSFGALRIGFKAIPKCLIQFDACYDSGYNSGIVYAQGKGIQGTTYVYPDMLDTAGKITSGQLATAYTNGWDVGIYPYNWINPGALDTQASAQAELVRVRDWLINSGYSRAPYHVAYPNGAYNDNALAALAATGMQTGRAGTGLQYFPLNSPYLLTRYVISTSVTLATAKGYVDNAIKLGIPVILVFHTLSATPTGNDWAIADYQSLIDYIVTTGIECVTISELFYMY